jgi:small subunit ribosomal protein S5
MPEEETVETEVSKSSGKYLLKSKKAEIRPKKRRRPERKTEEGSGTKAPASEGEQAASTEETPAPEGAVPVAEPEVRIPSDWIPKTELGRLVAKRDIATMEDALDTCLPLREPQIVDILVPNIEDEVIDVNMVQRMTDSGRRVRFTVTCVVGNGAGFVGLGRAKGKEVGPTIQKAIDNAKLNLIRVRRACGSWECGCMLPHTVPFKVIGKCGSAEVTLKPAPQGVKLAVGEVGKKILKMAGVKDVWSFTRGQTRTTVNFAYAVFDALQETIRVRVLPGLAEQLHITGGRQ